MFFILCALLAQSVVSLKCNVGGGIGSSPQMLSVDHIAANEVFDYCLAAIVCQTPNTVIIVSCYTPNAQITHSFAGVSLSNSTEFATGTTVSQACTQELSNVFAGNKGLPDGSVFEMCCLTDNCNTEASLLALLVKNKICRLIIRLLQRL